MPYIMIGVYLCTYIPQVYTHGRGWCDKMGSYCTRMCKVDRCASQFPGVDQVFLVPGRRGGGGGGGGITTQQALRAGPETGILPVEALRVAVA